MNAASLMSAVLTVVFVLTITGFIYGWWYAVARLLHGQPVLKHEPRLVPPWALVDIAVAYFLTAMCMVAAIYAVSQIYGVPVQQNPSERPPHVLVAIVAASGGASVLGITLSIIFVALRTRCTLADLGFDLQQLGADVKLGLLAFAMIAPPVFALQGLLAQFFEPHHPLIDMLQDDANVAVKWSLFSAVSFTAVIVAPVVEEVQFRLLLQGFLQRVAARGSSWSELLFGIADDRQEQKRAKPQPRTVSRKPAYLVIFISALVFAAMHYSHGPAPIPLFFFALGLGYVYHQTHRLLPSIIVHATLNLCTVLMLLQQLVQTPVE